MTPAPTRGTARGWQDDIHPRQETVDGMRHAAARRGETLLAAAFVRTGVHPYSAYAFLGSGGEVWVVETAMYWGSVRGKWVADVPRAAYEGLLESAAAVLDCAQAGPLGSVLGAALVHWPATGKAVLCSGDGFSEESRAFAEQVEELLRDGRQVYRPRSR